MTTVEYSHNITLPKARVKSLMVALFILFNLAGPLHFLFIGLVFKSLILIPLSSIVQAV